VNWTSFDQFLAMGGYAPYVWSSFGAVALALAAEVAALRRRRRAAIALARRAQAAAGAERRP
jgi:heme exporter protein D